MSRCARCRHVIYAGSHCGCAYQQPDPAIPASEVEALREEIERCIDRPHEYSMRSIVGALNALLARHGKGGSDGR